LGANSLPAWVGRINYADRYQIEPHKVNPPVRWWVRLGMLEEARGKRRAREAVERLGLGKVDPDQRRAYDDLIFELRGLKR
jgi:type II secretory pathway component PulJ